MRWFFSMKRTIVSPSGMPRLSSSSISDGRSSAFADTSPRYTPTHCGGCSLMRRGRSFESISADFENSRSPLAISSGSLPRRDSIGFSGSFIRSSSLKRRCRLHHDLRQFPSSGRFWAEHDAESTALKHRRHARDFRFAIDQGAHDPAVPGNARAVSVLPRSPHRRDSVLSCACFCRPGRRRLNAPAISPATIAAQTNSVPGTTGCDRCATRSASRSPFLRHTDTATTFDSVAISAAFRGPCARNLWPQVPQAERDRIEWPDADRIVVLCARDQHPVPVPQLECLERVVRWIDELEVPDPFAGIDRALAMQIKPACRSRDHLAHPVRR